MFNRKERAEEARLRELARIERFASLTDDELDAVIEAATYLTVPEDWTVMAELTPADKAYVLLAGEVSVRRHGEEIARLGPGEIIGEMALVEHRLRSASVVALTPLEVLHITAEAFETLLETVPHFHDVLIGAVEERHG
ncbi:hypothetical protein GCM10022215_07410 [Nocardioides fonticola]|uniref:Cyclic nucleotide-binding domain-containing protein n=1 Tax=Nocardioides fonticola TaxID=450363 RepID=A0ABP7XCK7_9ACTN